MSLVPRERQALDSIEDGLAASDPRLTSLLATFNRLAAGEALPERESLRAGRSGGRLLGQLIWPLMWLVVSAALISAAAIISRGGAAACSSWPAACGQRAPAHAVRPAAYGSAGGRVLHSGSAAG